MAVTQDSTAVAAKWARNLSGATQSIQAGVNSVTTAPGQAAAAAVQQYLAGVQAAVASGKWQRNVSAVSLQQWQQAMLTKGLPRIAAGASAATPKVQAFMGKFLPYLQGLQAKLASMPRGDINTNTQRAVTAIQYIAQFKNQ